VKFVVPNLSKLQPNPAWASLPIFDRTGWKRVRFGDVVENCNETCDPAAARLERFVAMEHLEPGSLHVRSWGNVADGTTFTRRCQPGQVLFGKRRAYQRKVAVAEFEAVVSGDIYVLAPKDSQRLLPELLPFLCLSERFFQHAVGTSAGSLSPRTNWSSLASFEFDLPPLDQQRRIAEILWAVDECAINAEALRSSLFAASDARISAAVSSGIRESELKETEIGLIPKHWQVRRIRELVRDGAHALLAGPFGTIFKAKDFRSEGVRIIQLRHVTPNGFVWGDNETYMDNEVYKRIHKPYTALPGDLLINKMGEPPGLACLYPEHAPLAMVTPDVVKASIDPTKADARFLMHVYNSRRMRLAVQKLIKGATRPRVSLNELFALGLPVPPLDEQTEIAEMAEALQNSADAALQSASNASQLSGAFTATLFSL